MDNITIKRAVQAFSEGKFVIIADDHDRENEGDLVIAAEKITPEAIAFMVRYTVGIICTPMLEQRLKELQLPQMVWENTESNRTAFTVSVDYSHGTTSGVSAEDRAKTIRALADPNSKPEDFRRPGHIFPLRYREGGVLKRAGHTEASIDLAKMAGMQPVTAICELTSDDGTMLRMHDLKEFSETHQIPLVTVADILRHRRLREKLVTCVSHARIPTKHGEFIAYVYESHLDGIQHLALVKGDITGKDNTLVRVHSECLTGDVFGSQRCDCGTQLDLALEKIAKNGSGVLVYLRGHEGRGIGIAHKFRAYELQDQGRDTVEANVELGFPVDSREYGIGAQILADLGVTKIRLLTNNPAKYGGLSGFDLQIVERVSLISKPTDENRLYLMAKQTKLGHMLEL